MARRTLTLTHLLAVLCLCLAAALPLQAAPKDQATLLADLVELREGDILWAEGHVEVFFKGQKLTATAISYDRRGEALTIIGPIRLVDEAGNVFTAEEADLSDDLAEGILTSARLVLEQKLQLTAARIQRAEAGNITALSRVAASSCTVCRGNPTPLWEIRAREVVHDAKARQIWFSNATLRFVGVPVLYLPVLRVPDPTQDRATGFLFPKLKSSTRLGTGVKLPYFIVLGKSRDLLLTPYLTGQGGKTVELRYRQEFRNGNIRLDGALTRDRLLPGRNRGYLALEGSFALGRDYDLSFKGITVTDPSYLSDYDISGADRLRNEIALRQLRRDLNFSARLVGLRSLRDNEANSSMPASMIDLDYERRLTPALLGGTLAYRIDGHIERRTSTLEVDTNGDGLAQGQDLSRLSLSFDWRRNWVTPQGLVLGVLTSASLDNYRILQDQVYGGRAIRLAGAVGAELRWPLVRQTRKGAVQTLEPVIQFVLSSPPDPEIPNGDSTLVELDETNLFALDRFPGNDAIEGGARVNIGLSFQHRGASGWALGLSAGRVLRTEDLGQFSQASGLSGLRSDWLLAWSFTAPDGFNMTNRLILDDSGQVDKAELRFGLKSRILNLSGGYEYLLADPDEARSETASEIVLEAGRDLNRFWHAELAARYDLQTDRLAKTGLELDFRNECIDVTLSMSRRYASSASQRPNTDFGLTVELLGFGKGTTGPSRTCRR